jgi:glycine cleavage system H protein
VAAGDTLGVLESVKAASEYYAPVSGKVTAVNEDLLETPGLINDDPYVRGWIVEMELEDRAQLDGLLTPEGYRKLLAGEGI